MKPSDFHQWGPRDTFKAYGGAFLVGHRCRTHENCFLNMCIAVTGTQCAVRERVTTLAYFGQVKLGDIASLKPGLSADEYGVLMPRWNNWAFAAIVFMALGRVYDFYHACPPDDVYSFYSAMQRAAQGLRSGSMTKAEALANGYSLKTAMKGLSLPKIPENHGDDQRDLGIEMIRRLNLYEPNFYRKEDKPL